MRGRDGSSGHLCLKNGRTPIVENFNLWKGSSSQLTKKQEVCTTEGRTLETRRASHTYRDSTRRPNQKKNANSVHEGLEF